ncbi:hypothetical protein MMC20_003276 [Loxospora ochrophaea]|nr:hypothetical protein [Loxospora ochrophaea]
MFPRPAFFPDAKLNYAENLLYPPCNPPEDSLAVIAATENSREHVTWAQLRERVKHCALALRNLGTKEGDRVAGYIGNHANALVCMLSTTAIGAVWTAVSPDVGVHAVLDRMQQIEPVILFADLEVMYNGRMHGSHEKLRDLAKELRQLRATIVFGDVKDWSILAKIAMPQGEVVLFNDFIAKGATFGNFEFAQLPPDHPVYILYSSGTTGKPKCIVHGAIGTLIQHKKEHDIQCDIQPGDRLFYYTTTTWMMWHWLVAGLAVGAVVVLYDGSPFRPLDEDGIGEMAMPRLIDEFSITHFGTSAKYLSVLEQKNVAPKEHLSLQTLKAIYSTGSPLAPSTFEYVYRVFGPDINLGSITGGTDIISLFGAPCQITPGKTSSQIREAELSRLSVYAGEIQVRGLGMAVEAWDYEGKDNTLSGEPGDLVCVKPFPSQPIYFFGPDGDKIYKKSYFETFPRFWHHGDFVKFNPKTLGMVMLGRSDGVLKPAGVRFGSSEIYNVVLKHFPEVEDALCIGRRKQTDKDETVVLFVKMATGKIFEEGLASRIQSTIRKELSARHVPSIVEECIDIPVTTNGKK